MAGAVAAAAEVIDDNLGPALGKFERIGAAQPAAGAGDDRDAILERNGHGCFST